MDEDRLEVELRAALRREVALTRVSVTARQIRAAIAARERARRTTRLAGLAAAAVLAVAVLVPVLGGVLAPGPAGPTAVALEPATVVALDLASGDLVLSRAWPDGRVEEAGRYPGGLDLLREATGGAATLPEDGAALAGHDGRLVVALSDGDLLVFRGPGGRSSHFVAGRGPGSVTWIGWAPDGRLVAVDTGAIRLVDADSGNVTTRALPASVMPDSARLDAVELLTWTGDGLVVARRSEPATFTSTIGTLDVTADVPTYEPGQPQVVRATTGLEPRHASDGSEPTAWSPDVDPGGDRVGTAQAGSGDGTLPDVSWYVAAAGERVFDVAWTAGRDGLVMLVAAADAGAGRVAVADMPGSWRDAVRFTGAAASISALGSSERPEARLRGIAPGGRSVAASIAGTLVVGDLVSGASVVLPAGTLFVGWPATVDVETASIPTLPACTAVTLDAAATVALSAAGSVTPASAGSRGVVGNQADADTWHQDAMRTAVPIEAPAGGQLVAALPAGACAEALQARAVPVAPSGATPPAPMELASRTADTGSPLAGLVGIETPPTGDWVVRVQLWFHDTQSSSILLYRVHVAGR